MSTSCATAAPTRHPPGEADAAPGALTPCPGGQATAHSQSSNRRRLPELHKIRIAHRCRASERHPLLHRERILRKRWRVAIDKRRIPKPQVLPHPNNRRCHRSCELNYRPRIRGVPPLRGDLLRVRMSRFRNGSEQPGSRQLDKPLQLQPSDTRPGQLLRFPSTIRLTYRLTFSYSTNALVNEAFIGVAAPAQSIGNWKSCTHGDDSNQLAKIPI